MDKNPQNQENNDSQWASPRSTFQDILQESRKRRVVIRNRSEKKVFDVSVLLVLILSIGAPVLPALVFLGVLVEAISVSLEKIEDKKPAV